MIKEVKIANLENKINFIDHNGIVCGFDMDSQCCEDFGYGVYDPSDQHLAFESPDNLPYHFVFDSFRKIEQGIEKPNNVVGGFIVPYFRVSKITANASEIEREESSKITGDDDIFQVVLEHDEDHLKRLIFECYNCHNGYYYHDFSIEDGPSPQEMLLKSEIEQKRLNQQEKIEELLKWSQKLEEKQREKANEAHN